MPYIYMETSTENEAMDKTVRENSNLLFIFNTQKTIIVTGDSVKQKPGEALGKILKHKNARNAALSQESLRGLEKLVTQGKQ